MSKIGKPRTAKGLAVFCGKIALEKLAKNYVVLDLSEIESAPASYFAICDADSDVQIRAITEAVLRGVKKFKIGRPRTEGLEAAYWVLLDFFDVVVHIMSREARNYYKLERLWSDAKFYILNEDGKLRSFNPKNLDEIYDATE